MRTEIDVTETFVEIATAEALMTIVNVGEGQLLINTVAADAAALVIAPTTSVLNEQIEQDKAESTFVRAKGLGWKLTLDV